VLVVTGLALFLVALDPLVVSTAPPAIRVDVQASIGRLEWTINAYVLTFGVLLMTAACVASVAAVAQPELPDWRLVAPLVLSGTGFALAIPPSKPRSSVRFRRSRSARHPGRSRCCANSAASSASPSSQQSSPLPADITQPRPSPTASPQRCSLCKTACL
jgi:hypothetical protein